MISAIELQLFHIGVLIALNLTHVLSHLAAARIAGVSVYSVSLGFGPTFWSTQRSGTTYRIAVPFGVFVRLKTPVRSRASREVPENKSMYEDAGVIRRLAIAVSPLLGVALLGYGFAFLHESKPTCDVSTEPVVGHVHEDTPSAAAGLEDGDRILTMNGVSVESFDEMVEVTTGSSGEEMDLLVRRGDDNVSIAVTPEYNESLDRYLIGITPERVPVQPLPFCERAHAALKLVADVSRTLVKGITGQVREVSGPVMIGEISDLTKCGDEEMGHARQARIKLLVALAVCIQLFVFFALPGPFFDGRRIVFAFLAAVFPRPGIYRFEWWYDRIFGALLLLLMGILVGWAVLGDLMRLVEL